nr:hypothetical secreted protein containing periplasmic copper-binding and DUF 11 domains [uncultured archaeon]
MHKVRIMVDVKIKIALGLIAILILAAPVTLAQEVPAHVVISEVFYDESSTDNNEFCELYNPTDSDIDIGGWKLKAFNQAGVLKTTTTLPDSTITAHKFYLIGEKNPLNSSDWGGTEISPDCLRGGSNWQNGPDDYLVLEDSGGNYIDGVRWGHEDGNNPLPIPDVPDNNTAPDAAAGKSIERKSLDVGYAPCQDTDNNSLDFFKQDTPAPKNSLSPEMDPAPVELFDADGNFKGGSVKIQDALGNASDGYTIHVDNGTYNENLAVAKQLTICSEHGAAFTTISASDSTDNVIAVTADYVTITGFNVVGATQQAGIYLCNADYCNITNNSASNNKIGIHLQMGSQHNTITNNNVLDNEDGISLSSSDDNHIYNNYFDNANNADDTGNNIWNITKADGSNIIGGPYLGGNYWSDYAGADTDDDGLGDFLLPYNSNGNIQNGGDMHPLVPVGSAPKLSIEKSDEPDPIQPGGTLNYTIIVENTGNAIATNVNVTETYDENVTFTSAVPAPSHGNDTWIFPMLNLSETKWINISATVNPTTPIGTVLYNSVNVSCDEGVTDLDTEATRVSAVCALPEITSFAPPSPVNDTVGAWRIFNVTVNQRVNVSWYLDAGHRHTNESVREASFTLQAEVGEHIVTANASNGNGSDSHSWVWNVKQPGISITKVSSVTEGVHSTNVNFTINVINTGDCTLNPVKVVDTLPAGMSYVAIGTSPAPSIVLGNTITWNIVDPLNPGDSTKISLIAHIDTGAEGTLTNIVNATGKPPAGDNVTGSDTADVTVLELDIVVISEVFYDESGTEDNNEFCELYNPTDSDIDIGDWTLKAFNQDGALKTTTLFPTGTSITAHKFYLIGEKNPLNSGDWGGTAISPDCLRGGSNWQNGPDDYLVLEDSGGNYIDGVRWGHKDGNNPPSIPDVPDNNTAPDAAAGKSIERKPLDGGYAPCQDTDNNALDFVVQETPTPKNSSSLETGISVTKVSSVTEGVPSSNVNFTINVTNTGDCTLNSVKVVDRLPAGMSYVAIGTSPAPSIVLGNTITWNIVDPLNPDDFTIISLIAQIDTGAEGTLTNLVNATGKPLAGDNVTGSDTADVTVLELDIVVISEVFYDESGTTDNNEFCELYNPTNNDIDIGDWTLKAFNQDGALKTTTIFPVDANITAHKFYLIGEKNPLNSSDWGGTAISPDCLRGGSDWQNGPDDYLVLEDSSGNYIDGVRWGHDDSNNPPPIPDVPDNNTAPDAAKGKSIERKPLGGGYAPCQDTDNNFLDFFVQDTPTPKNSSSLETGISVTKVGNVTDAAPSTFVKFNITVTNTGNCTLDHVLVEDTLPAGMTYSSSDPLANSTNGAITWNIVGPLAAGASKTIELVAKIEEDAEGVLTNTVDVTGTPEIGTNVYASATAQVRVIRVAIEKSCKSSTVSLGGTVEYTIKYSNPNEVDLTNVVITENYPKNLTFISAVPAPDSGTNNKWTIGTLPAGESGKITIKMKVLDSVLDLSYTESGSVSGEGIVMISKELSTKVEPFDLENIVTISGSYGETKVNATASAITTVSVSGSSLEITEHGSGIYEAEEELSVSPEKMGIKFDKTTNAEYRPTTFKCSDGFVMEVPSKWSQDICIKNYVKKSAIHKTITEATTLEDDTRINTDNKGYSMTFDSTFLGYLHVDKKTKDAATSEHYIGEFEIKGWDQSGKEIVDGVGYVIVDKELSSGRLLLMEHGSGYYWSEEDSSSNSIKKITDAEYEPTAFNFSDGFVVNFSSKWMQDVCARSGTGTSALRKKIRDATYIDDDTIASSSPSLKFETFFYGATHVGSISIYSKASEDYIGDFYISWGASSTFIFDWGDVPGLDNDDLIKHLSEPRFNMSWVTDDDVKITKSTKKHTITISTPEHSAKIILDTETYETAELIVDGVYTYTFNVVKYGNTLKVYDPELKRKPEVVSGEGFVMVDEAIFQDGEIEVTEHGSGTYYSEEAFGSKTIKKSTYGEYKPTYFSFSDSFSVNLSSLWMQDICVKDKKEGTALHKKISDAALMKDDTIAAKSSLELNSSFNGSMHIGARTENVSISEDYIGEFNVTQLIKIVKKKPKSSSETFDWLSCPCPIPSSIYQWFCQDPTYRVRWLSVCPYPYKDHWLYIHP